MLDIEIRYFNRPSVGPQKGPSKRLFRYILLFQCYIRNYIQSIQTYFMNSPTAKSNQSSNQFFFNNSD